MLIKVPVRFFQSPLIFSLCCFPLAAQQNLQQTAAQSEFFEKNVRPVFVKSCQACHNSKLKTSGVDLTTGAGLDPARLVKAVSYSETIKMPPAGKLKPEEIESLTNWVKLGAVWPGAQAVAPPWPAAGASFTPEQKAFWAFQPMRKVSSHSDIDGFIREKLAAQGLKPAPRADKLTLLRRATYDLIGLPPTVQEIQDFLSDNSPKAFEKVVDRLLASPRYGERWGRHWLDVARYADSTGNDEDHRYPYAWRYRDYVIDVFNNDYPYDKFVREQVAGDLLPATSSDPINRRGIVATGFLALGAKAIANPDKQKMMYDIYDEQVDVTSKAFLGVTMACARCHNHKFDPIYTKDYYSFVSIFASTKQFSDTSGGVAKLLYVPLVPDEQYAAYKAQQDKLTRMRVSIDEIAGEDAEKYTRTQSARLADYMLAARSIYEGGKTADEAAGDLDKPTLTRWVTYLKEGRKAHPQLADWDAATPEKQAEVAAAYQTRFQTQFDNWTKIMDKWRLQVRKRSEAMDMPPPPKPKFEAATDLFFYETYIQHGPFGMTDRERETILSPEVKDKIAALRKESDDLRAHAMPEPDMACAVAEGKPVEQKVLVRGDYNSPGEEAPRAFPKIISSPSDPQFKDGSGRLELANWLIRPENPLTARVMVNRIWQWHFGEGIVRTPDNFGKMGDRPSHPELLDFLARKFIESGWSIKSMHRLMMLSNAYQTASDTDTKTMEADPENRLLAHFNRQRLDVEEIRDGVLALDGSLDLTMGGTLQKGFGTDSENSADRLSVDPTKLTRRTVYLPLRRANLPTLLNLLDFGDATTVNGKRTLTNVAPQTLFMMNSEFGFEHARKIAGKLEALPEASDSKRIEAAYLQILNRKPDPGEVDTALTYINHYAKKYGPEGAWPSFCHVLMGSNEFVYVD